jgi:hypothetical protein
MLWDSDASTNSLCHDVQVPRIVTNLRWYQCLHCTQWTAKNKSHCRNRKEALCVECTLEVARCSACGEVKSRDQFYAARSRVRGIMAYCKVCSVGKQTAYLQKQRQDNPDFFRNRNLKFSHRITLAERHAMFEAQDGCCAICRTPEGEGRLHVDHHHESGRIRALLCHGCNKGIGFLKENPAVIRAAADYVEEHSRQYHLAEA